MKMTKVYIKLFLTILKTFFIHFLICALFSFIFKLYDLGILIIFTFFWLTVVITSHEFIHFLYIMHYSDGKCKVYYKSNWKKFSLLYESKFTPRERIIINLSAPLISILIGVFLMIIYLITSFNVLLLMSLILFCNLFSLIPPAKDIENTILAIKEILKNKN